MTVTDRNVKTPKQLTLREQWSGARWIMWQLGLGEIDLDLLFLDLEKTDELMQEDLRIMEEIIAFCLVGT